jgi:hypothetical protein
MAIRKMKADDFLKMLPKTPTQQRVANSPFAPYAQAVGWVCMRLSHLEMVVTNLLCVLIPVDNVQVSQSLAYGMDMRQKLKTLRGVGAVRRPDDPWYERLEKIIGTIEGRYLEQRNRYAHDVWAIDKKSNEMVRFHFKIEIPKQSKPGEQRTLRTMHTPKMNLSEMYAVSDQMDEAAQEVDNLRQLFISAQPKT